MATVFVSPGIYTREQDFTVFASRIGITRLGLVGKTQKGPAFEPIKISTTDNFLLRFGGTNPNLPLPYVANSFLTQSNELTITRILGKEGFTNSPAWIIMSDINNSFSGETTIGGAMTFSDSDSSSVATYIYNFATNSVMSDGVITASTVGTTTTISYSGNVTTNDLNVALSNDAVYTALGVSASISNASFIITGLTSETLNVNVLESKGEKSGSTLAILRSKRNQISNSFYFDNESDVTIGATTTTLGSFMLSAATGPLTGETGSGFTVSLDETRDDYIVKILGKNPQIIANAPDLYVERIYPHFVREASSRGDVNGVYSSLAYTTESAYTDFANEYKNSITPWFVSRVIGGAVRDLFRVQTISDGNSSSKEIKISVSNIDINNNTFDIIVRRFDDTDATVGFTALERWSNLSMDENDSLFIGKVIGTTDENYPRKSDFITIDLAPSFPIGTVPAGFRGYKLRETGISGSTSSDIYYKTDYLSGDTVFKTYLGISELGYSNFTTDKVSTKNAVKTVEIDLFVFDGGDTVKVREVKGFHLENTADATKFTSGSKNSITGYTNNAGTLVDKNKLKFTVLPVGGFDGWDKYQTYSEGYEEFTDAYLANVKSFKEGINTFQNSEVVDINIFATPGINFSNNTSIIKHALDVIESRSDAIYIIDSPRITSGSIKGTPEEVVSRLEATGLDSNYATTYWPWIQIEDQSTGRYSYQSPTSMAVKAYAYTDNRNAPWFAPAGLIRGLAGSSVVRADVPLSVDGRDTLYEGRVNPIATFIQNGTVAWGQKTLQVRGSSLDRVGIRRLLLQVRRLVAAASLSLVFEPNDQELRDQFLARVEPILLQIQNQRGLDGFKVIMDDTNNTPDTIDRNTLIGKIQLIPARTAEFVDLTFQVLPTGAKFEEF